MPTDSGAPGRRFSYWLADTLRAERTKADQPIELIAYVLGVNPRTIERFEDPAHRDDTGEKPWGRDIDRVVAVYAYVLGVEDPRDLWQLALDRWRDEGERPDFLSDLPPSTRGFIRPLWDEARRQRQALAEQQEKRRAMQSRRGAR